MTIKGALIGWHGDGPAFEATSASQPKRAAILSRWSAIDRAEGKKPQLLGNNGRWQAERQY
jgi:hypothetical protein